MDRLVAEKRVCKEQRYSSPVRPIVKKSFEEAVAECNGRSVSEFIDELRKRVKESYRNAKS